MTHHEYVRGHGFEVAQRVEQGFALAGGGGRHVQGNDIRRQPLRRQLKGGAGARGVLEEHIAHRLAAQQRDFFYCAGADFKKGIGGVENFSEQLARQAIKREEVAQLALIVELQRALGVGRRHGEGLSGRRYQWVELVGAWCSRVSGAGPSNFTRSLAASDRVAPTTSGRIGSSRELRSSRLTRVTLAGRP